MQKEAQNYVLGPNCGCLPGDRSPTASKEELTDDAIENALGTVRNDIEASRVFSAPYGLGVLPSVLKKKEREGKRLLAEWMRDKLFQIAVEKMEEMEVG